ncbi:L,D-transpeptidase [Flexibacterium corallicola]|uniref:L,D-transpeptidase n=1 Tax=Flexibacterium corallicola TaxID=3037259 RepID=UPI00286F6674|nr:L,D-transpeptidase [Pseudovibrio sp. M1P-2-3]
MFKFLNKSYPPSETRKYPGNNILDLGQGGPHVCRRGFVVGSLAFVVGCQTIGLPGEPPLPEPKPDYEAMYAATSDGDFNIPAVRYKRFDHNYLRQVADYPNSYSPGTIVVDPYAHHLYWTLNSRKALRYGIGVGKAGYAWNGKAIIRAKAEWPFWRPPQEMIKRKPHLQRYWQNGMPGGPKNPLGARAMYLWQGNEDTLYRIHGTNNPNSIGRSVSSGCIRMWHQDVIDLYKRVPRYTRVVVIGKTQDTEKV